MIVSGVLLLADAALTLTWQEPISAYLADRQQAKLERQFVDLPVRKVRNRREREELKGDAIARIDLPAIHKRVFVVEGTDTSNLRKGPGHYPKTPLPGEHGTVAIAGHRTTYGAPFRHIDDLHTGDTIFIDMPDGTFVYRVDRTRIVPADATWVTRPVGHDQLVLTACHPLHSAAQRIVAFARFVRRQRPRVTS
jgi:sortase A